MTELWSSHDVGGTFKTMGIRYEQSSTSDKQTETWMFKGVHTQTQTQTITYYQFKKIPKRKAKPLTKSGFENIRVNVDFTTGYWRRTMLLVS
jgi:hypothetical protein